MSKEKNEKASELISQNGFAELQEALPLSSATPNTPAPHYLGHRDRARQRLRKVGDEALQDYELLELLLFRSIQRADTKPLAKALLARFGSLNAVLNAPEHLLKEVKGCGSSIAFDLRLISAVVKRSARGEVMNQVVMDAWSKVVQYCVAAMAHEEIEQFRILFLDRKNRLIADEVQQRGTVDHTPVYPREVIRRALELSSTAIIVVHNHPSGDPTPSHADIEMTKTLIDAGKPLGITIHDHIIIGKYGQISMRGLKII